MYDAGLRGSGFRLRGWGLGENTTVGLGIRISGFEFGVSGFRFRVSKIRFWDSDSSGLEYPVWGLSLCLGS